MIALVAASAIYLTGLQATINAPRSEFMACLKEASSKAANDKVIADAYPAYVRNACGGQLDALKSALVSFDMKNGLSRKAAASGAETMIDDYVQSSLERYSAVNKSIATAAPAAAAPAVTPAATPAPTAASAPK